jgi:hypothetical protein
MGVGVEAASAAHVQVKPIPHGALGHYRSCVRFAWAAGQDAASRMWEVRNTSTNIIIPTRLRVAVLQNLSGTAARFELNLFRLTGFTAVDTTNTVTPTASVKRTAGMAAAPGGAAIRHVTVAGAAAGMTGGTLTKDGGSAAIIELWGLATLPTAGPVPSVMTELLDDVNGTHPFALAQNEGIEIENVVDIATTTLSIIVDFSWAEVTAY